MDIFTGTKKRTRRAFYGYLREKGMATKQDLALDLGLSVPTVSKYLTNFLEAGLLEKAAKLEPGPNGGRSPLAYSCVAAARYAVGVDITRDHVSSLVIDLERTVVHRRQAARPFSRSQAYMEFLGAEIAALITEAGIDVGSLLGVGIAIPGLISKASGAVVYGRVIDNFGLTAEDFGRYVPHKTVLVHDSDAAGLAEFWGNEGLGNAFYISLGRSVGGSVLINNRVYQGEGDFSGEIGHVTIQPDGLECYCGRRGCLDPYCNASVLDSIGAGSLDGFFSALSVGEAAAVEVWARYTAALALAVHNVRCLFGSRVILGGEVGPHLGGHMDALWDSVDALSFRDDPARDYLTPCAYRTESIATGAALFLVQEFLDDPGA